MVPSADNNLAIRWASDRGHIDIVNRLLEDLRVDPSADNNLAIRWASDRGHIDIVNRLLEDLRVYNDERIKIKIMYEMGLPEDLILYEIFRYLGI
jgi:ankyrin repeat protein